MDVAIRFPEEDDDATIRSLCEWLRRDPDVSREVTVRLLGAPAGPEDQGGAFEAIQLVFTDLVSLANVLIAYGAWRSTRTSKPKAEFERDGRRVEDSDGSADSRQRVIDALSENE
ncbi:hypothetical protein GCM10029978_081440 [Actinoallomurus acanthiterrae]